MSYDPTFRARTIKYREAHSLKETCEAFGVNASSVQKWQELLRKTGGLEDKPSNRKHRKIDSERLGKDVQERPDDFLSERAVRFGCSDEGIRKALGKIGITEKKTLQVPGEILSTTSRNVT